MIGHGWLRRAMVLVVGAVLSVVVATPAVAGPGGAAGTAAGHGSASVQAVATWDARTGARLDPWECSTYNICFFTGRNGTGSRCTWDVADADWAGGAVRCSWALTTNVASVMNLGTSDDGSTGVAFYRGTNYTTRAGCIRNQHGGNLAGTYKLRSHKWISSSCG